MKRRTVKEIFNTEPVIEGAGVHLQRVFSQPQVPKFDPFLLLDDFGSSEPDDYMKGFPWHPHRGIETVTYMKSGEVEHQDSLGNRGVIREGDVQWMTAGSGIIHQEMPQLSTPALRGFQLWVNLPKGKKMSTPRYRGLEKKDIPEIQEDGCLVRIIAGDRGGVAGPAQHLYVDVRYFDVEIEPGKTFVCEVPHHYTAFVYVYEGSVRLGPDTVIKSKQGALTGEGDILELHAYDSLSAKCIVVAGEPIGEPVAWGGPIVMNTNEEVEQAFWEYQNNEFIK